MSERSVAFVRSIVARFPGLTVLLEEHIKDFDEVLPHVFFGDLTRHVVSLALLANTGGERAAAQELCGILDFLEETYAMGSIELQELISVSFLENLPRPSEEGSEIRAMVGPSLSHQLRSIG